TRGPSARVGRPGQRVATARTALLGDVAMAEEVGHALPGRDPFGPRTAPAPHPAAHSAAYPKLLRVVDHRLHPEDPAGFLVHLEPVPLHAVLDAAPRQSAA